MGGVWWAVAGALSLALVACGARTELSSGEPPPRDAAADSAEMRDTSLDTRPPPVDTEPPIVDGGPTVACAADRECETGTTCVADVAFLGEDLEPVPLICSRRFPGASDGELCDEAADCDRGLCVVAGSCVRPCIDDGDCEPGDRCRSVLARTGALSLQPYDGCVAVEDAPEGVVATVEDRPGALSRRPSDLRLERLPTAGGTTWIVSPTAAPDLELEPSMLVDPEGTVLFDLAAIDFGSPPPINPVVPRSRGTLALLMPNSPRTLPAGTSYVLTTRAADRSGVQVVALGVDGRRRRRIDLDLYYVGGGDLRPSGSRGSRLVVEGLAEVERLLDVEIGTVRQHAVVGGTRASLSIIEETGDGDLPELAELFQLSAGAARASIDVFFVRQSGMALGVAGGIPGPPAMHGTAGSGISIAADFLDVSRLSLGKVLAHELGHYLGLFHTTERVGVVLEPLDDTLECRIENDLDGDGILSDSECSAFGSDNLMFWTGDGMEMSSDQRAIVQRSAVVY